MEFINYLKAFISFLETDDIGLIFGLIVAVIAMFFSNLFGFVNGWLRIRDKNKEIDRIVESRNKYEDYYLKGNRVSSERGKDD